MPQNRVLTVVLNYHGEEDLRECIRSLSEQAVASDICIVDNEENEASQLAIGDLRDEFPGIYVVSNAENLGFAGGVNCGIRLAVAYRYPYFALLNNDATVHDDWLKNLIAVLDANPKTGIATGLTRTMDNEDVDSAGIAATRWGTDYSRGRGLHPTDPVLQQGAEVFGASAGASLYRTALAEDIGFFDEDFFAYYEDLDYSWRARLAGWNIEYVPTALANHKIGASSSKMPGFTVYQMFKNMPMVVVKNVPRELLPKVLPRFILIYFLMLGNQIRYGSFRPALRGFFDFCRLLPSKMSERRSIQRNMRYETNRIADLLSARLPDHSSLSFIYRVLPRKSERNRASVEC